MVGSTKTAAKGNGSVHAPEPGLFPEPETDQSPGSVFDNLAALRLSPEAAATVGTREVLRHVPVRKPSRTEWVRVHPDVNMQLTTGVFVDREERGEVYFVSPHLRNELTGEWKPIVLATTISRQGVLLLWPVPLPDERGKSNPWADTARDACSMAQREWVRVVPDMSLGAYRVHRAEGVLPDPVWPDITLSELLKLGFKDRVIDNVDHPVVRRLRGVA